MITRRTFLIMTHATLGAPFVVQALPLGKPRVGIVRLDNPIGRQTGDSFIAALRDLGWNDGQNVNVDWRRRDEEIAELVRLKVDVLVLPNPHRLEAGLRLTKTIPIVGIDLESDPVARGFATSLARPGGNVTGIWLDLPEIAGKQLQLLKEAVPDLHRVAVLWDDRIARPQFTATETAARTIGVSVYGARVRDDSEIESAVKRVLAQRPQALLALTSPIVIRTQNRIAELALRNRLASITGFTTFPAAGGLMAYGPNFDGLFRQAASYVDRILKGTRPGDLPIARPTTFELIINAKTAKALGLTIPQSLLLQADSVIE